ncbi:hypothetical protein BGX26_012247 [Mortierella sp. AD094]|nr:hypothetical protein BGX26_012247 [Mortierella sp. AD094]
MNPLLLPEIVLHLGRFIPSKTLLACLLVCRTWNSALHSLLWYVVDCTSRREGEVLQRITMDSLSRNAQYIHIFIGDPHFDAPICLPNLVELSLRSYNIYFSYFNVYSAYTKEATAGEDDYKAQMIELNPHIKKLSWTGDNSEYLYLTKCLLNLTHLTELRLSRWYSSGGALKSILDTVASTLTSLELHDIQGIQSADLEDVVLPSLISLDIYLNSMLGHGVGMLLRQCPNLSRLVVSFDLEVMLNLKREPSEVAEWIRAESPASLSSFSLDGFFFPDANEVVELIRGIQNLDSFQYQGPLTLAIANAIVECHGEYFKELRLCTPVSDSFEVEALAILLVSCPRLENLFIECDNPVFTPKQMEKIFEHPWVCLGLKELSLSHVVSTQPLEVRIAESSSSLHIGLGWYVQSRTRDMEEFVKEHQTETLMQLFEHVQGMSRLKTMRMSDMEYSRFSIPNDKL